MYITLVMYPCITLSLNLDIPVVLDRPVGTRPSLLEITVGPYVTLCVRSESETTT